MNYKESGVDIDRGEALVKWLKSESTPTPHQKQLVAGVGGFAALFRASFSNIKKPCLVSSTDGVGSKLKLAIEFDQYTEVAQDLVAMCVNDLLCCGADPLFFLDYYACNKIDFKSAQSFLTGLKKACLLADCALIGGETAEMPDLYQKKDFDCAGFCVGVVDEDLAWGCHKVKPTDVVLGVSSSGFHSNGYSLLRKIFANDLPQWKDKLLKPTEIYVKLVKQIKKINVSAACHITGGGINNLLRILPKNTFVQLKPWVLPKIFLEAQTRSQLTNIELLKTFNCGVGFVFIVQKKDKQPACEIVSSLGHKVFDLGCVELQSTDQHKKEQEPQLKFFEKFS